MKEQQDATLSICIVNWNSGDHLRTCIASIGNAKKLGFTVRDVVIVDNGSSDASLNDLERLKMSLTIIRNTTNRGFATACNQAAAITCGEYLLFLNPDTRLNDGSLVSPIAFMKRKENEQVGICGIQLVDEAGMACLSYAKFPTLRVFLLQALGINKSSLNRGKQWHKDIEKGSDAIVVDQVIGAFFMTRRSMYDGLGGFDERFFVYYEEVDFSLRARRKGFESVCLRTATCMHAEGGSSRQVKAERLFYSLRSRLLFGFKHYSGVSAIILMIITFGELLSRLAYSLARRRWSDVRHTMRGYAMLFSDLPAIFRVIGKGRRVAAEART